MNRHVVYAAVALVLGASCGVSADGQLEQIDSADLFGLDVTTTSTSTSTTSTTLVPQTVPVETTHLATTTTIATDAVDLYFLDGNRLEPVSIPLARNPSPQRVVRALVDGEVLSSDVGIGLRTLLPEDLVNTAAESGTGFVTVDVAGEPFDSIDQADQRAAIAQIVLTLVGRPGVGQVQVHARRRADARAARRRAAERTQASSSRARTTSRCCAPPIRRRRRPRRPTSRPRPATTVAEP